MPRHGSYPDVWSSKTLSRCSSFALRRAFAVSGHLRIPSRRSIIFACCSSGVRLPSRGRRPSCGLAAVRRGVPGVGGPGHGPRVCPEAASGSASCPGRPPAPGRGAEQAGTRAAAASGEHVDSTRPASASRASRLLSRCFALSPRPGRSPHRRARRTDRRGRTHGVVDGTTHNRRRRSSAAALDLRERRLAPGLLRHGAARRTATARSSRDDGGRSAGSTAPPATRGAPRGRSSAVAAAAAGGGARAGVGFTNVVDVDEPGGGPAGTGRGGFDRRGAVRVDHLGTLRCRSGPHGRQAPAIHNRAAISKSRGTAGATWFLYRIKISSAICSFAPPLKLGAAAQMRAVQHFSVTTLSSF